MTDQTAGPVSATSLVVVSGHGKGAIIPLPGGELLLGRGSEQAGALAGDPLLSRQHARLSTDGSGQVYLEDLGSSNGTRLNGAAVSGRQPVRAGDLIEVGGSTLRLVEPAARATDRTIQVQAQDRTLVQPIPSVQPVPPVPPVPGSGDPLAGSQTGGWADPFANSVPAAPLFPPAGSQPPARPLPAPAAVVPPAMTPPPSGAGGGARAAQAVPQHGTVTVTGRVRGFERRSEPYGNNGQSVRVWNFRLERYDSAGNRERPIPVQLRSWKIDGSLRDEDEVTVSGQMKNGTLRGERVENLTTGASIAVKSIARSNMIGCLIFLAVIFVFGSVIGLFALLGG